MNTLDSQVKMLATLVITNSKQLSLLQKMMRKLVKMAVDKTALDQALFDANDSTFARDIPNNGDRFRRKTRADDSLYYQRSVIDPDDFTDTLGAVSEVVLNGSTKRPHRQVPNGLKLGE